MYANTSSKPLCLALLLLLSGCALVVQGTSQEVTFTSTPAGATFTVAGQTATTPATLDIPKDDYQVAFQRTGYKETPFTLDRKLSPWFFGSIAMGVISSSIDVATGAWKEFTTTEVHVDLIPLPGTTQELPVTVTSEPPGAAVLVGGASYGKTPVAVQLPWAADEREKRVELRLAGHQPLALPLARAQKELRAELTAMPDVVTVRVYSKPEGALVTYDGAPRGRTPCSLEATWRRGDPPRPVVIELAGYLPVKRDINREATDLFVELEEAVERIALPLRVDPPAAKVLVDGQPLADGVREVLLPWSVSRTKHTITLSCPGYASRTLEVVRATAAQPLEVRLVPSLPGTP